MHCRDDAASVNWIADNASLAETAKRWLAQGGGRLGLDTEFIRTDTFFPRPGLYQVACAGEYYLLDPLGITDWSPFIDLLKNPDVVKVMHACLEDLELMHHHLGVVPANVFDTQLAHAFVSSDFSLSYQALVTQRLGIELDKHETRSDWLARPLTDAQVAYAVEDVVHLVPLYEQLVAALESTQRVDWFFQEMQQRGEYLAPDPANYYQGVKKAWKLEGQALGRLQALCHWRETTARQRNVPRNRVVWDEHLVTFSQLQELTQDALYANLPRVVVRNYGQDLQSVHAASSDGEPPAQLPRPLSAAQGARLKIIRGHAVQVAESLGVAPELLARKRDLEACIRHHAMHGELSPLYQSGAWRDPLLRDQLLAVLSSDEAKVPSEGKSL